MKPRLVDFTYILLTVILTVYSQLMIKSRIAESSITTQTTQDHFRLIGWLFTDVRVLSGFAAGFVAVLCWMVALSKFQLSYAYPFTSLSFVLVLLFSAWMLKEPVNALRIVGVALIVLGTVIASRS